MSKIPVVQVVDGDGFKIINKSDFDPSLHKVYVQPVKKIKKQFVATEDEGVDT